MSDNVKMLGQDAENILQYFEYGHLPSHLQAISKPFSELADRMAERLSGPEFAIGLRKLLEAKDCMVRAALNPSVLSTSERIDAIDNRVRAVMREVHGLWVKHQQSPTDNLPPAVGSQANPNGGSDHSKNDTPDE